MQQTGMYNMDDIEFDICAETWQSYFREGEEGRRDDESGWRR